MTETMPYCIQGKDASRRRSLLAKRLEELAAARHELLLQLEELDIQTRNVRLEYNELAPISSLPDEVLTMIFEAGVLLEELHEPRFALLVSHIARRWRGVVLAIPHLWNKIVWDIGLGLAMDERGEDFCPDLNQTDRAESWTKAKKKVAFFLSRSVSAPIDIYIKRFSKVGLEHHYEATSEILALLQAHFHRCRHLSFQAGAPLSIKHVLGQVCSGPAPLISSIDLGINHAYQEDFRIHVPLFPSGAPQLKTAQLDWIDVTSIRHCLEAFQHLQSLRLIGITLNDDDDNEIRASLANALISMPVLNHLELNLYEASALYLPTLVQPTIQFLHIHAHHSNEVIQRFEAVSVTTLSVNYPKSSRSSDFALEGSLQANFPSLKHLILTSAEMRPSQLVSVSHKFSHIERLTCRVFDPVFDIGNVLDAIDAYFSLGDGYSGSLELADAASISIHWPKLHTIAASGLDPAIRDLPLDPRWDAQVSVLQAAGIPIRKLMLPPILVAQTGEECMAKLRELVEVKDFSLDWPTPFERFTGV
ncbi:hypothetical protein HWV62_43948 [Athelia sp. TMB]|nr:hypothetical protein HWV62_43948 [Athelia sp. TMB]